MKKIAFVDNSLWGLLNFRSEVIKALKEDGNKIVLIAPLDTENTVKKLVDISYVPIKLSRRGKNIFSEIRYFFNLLKIYKKEKFDLVFHYTIKPNVYGNFAAKLCKTNSISIIPGLGHMFLGNEMKVKLVSLLYKFSLRYAKEVWFLNNVDRELFIEKKIVPINKTRIIPGEGIDTQKFIDDGAKKDNKKIVFLMIARIMKEKGVIEYIQAAKHIKKMRNDVEFQLLGSIENTDITLDFIKKYHKKGIINYLGTSNCVKEIIARADCVVLPSYREGMSRTLLEGASMSKPLIASNVPGCREIVVEEYNGYLCEPKSSISLIMTLKKFLKLNADDKKKLGINSRKRVVKEFSMEKIIDIYRKEVTNEK